MGTCPPVDSESIATPTIDASSYVNLISLISVYDQNSISSTVLTDDEGVVVLLTLTCHAVVPPSSGLSILYASSYAFNVLPDIVFVFTVDHVPEVNLVSIAIPIL